jgi:hypothetical protein
VWLAVPAVIATLLAYGCANQTAPPRMETDGSASLACLVDPDPASAERDLFLGPGGARWQPPPGPFRFHGVNEAGWSPKMEVEDPNGIVWHVKLGPESRTEVVASRLLWAIGFHQPPTYYVASWTLEGGPAPGPQPPARFRPELPDWKREGTWDWRENPFVGTRELKALFVFMALVNNWDLKREQNVVYERDHASPRRIYVVRDLGASFGRSGWFAHTKDDVEGFEAEPFIRGLAGDRVKLGFRIGYARERDLDDDVTVDAVVWLCRRLDALRSSQWSDAFRAGGYPEAEARRFVARLRNKVDEGLRLAEDRS